jgi:hypothetical protein
MLGTTPHHAPAPAAHVRGIVRSGPFAGAAFDVAVDLPGGWRLEQLPRSILSSPYSFRLVHGRTRLTLEPFGRLDTIRSHWNARRATQGRPRKVLSDRRVETLGSNGNIASVYVQAVAPWPLVFQGRIERGANEGSDSQAALADVARTLRLRWRGP